MDKIPHLGQSQRPEINTLTDRISESKDFHELYRTLEVFGYRRKVNIIRKVRQNELSIDHVTRDHGLRDKVKELIEIFPERQIEM